MKRFSDSNCCRQNVFRQLDPTAFSEIEFEAEVVKALSCLLPNYLCGVFAGSFLLDSERRMADLALIHKSMTHWFVVEVELACHSLDLHVLPQLRCLRFGDAEEACITSLCRGFTDLDRAQAELVLRYLPRFGAVVVNQYEPTWEATLRGLEIQLLVVSVFEDSSGRRAHELEGHLHVPRESIGFAKYSAPDRSLLLPKSCGLPIGSLMIEDIYGNPAVWVSREAGNGLWVTKEHGTPDLTHGSYVQVFRTFDGRISLRMSL
jgi:hypothetical protein